MSNTTLQEEYGDLKIKYNKLETILKDYSEDITKLHLKNKSIRKDTL